MKFMNDFKTPMIARMFELRKKRL